MPSDLRDTIATWLDALGCPHHLVDDPHMEWRYEVRYPSQRENHVMHVAGVPGPMPSVAIVSVTRLAPAHVQRFQALPDDEKRTFLFGLRHALNGPEVEFELKGEGGLACPEAFQVSVRRFQDGLTLDGFARSLGAVYKTELATVWFIQETLDFERETPPVFFDLQGGDIPEA